MFLFAIGFVRNILVPKSIDSGVAGSRAMALLVNAALLTLFALQHGGMARPAFKRWFTRVAPTAVERSTYVLLASAALALLNVLWRPLPKVVWSVTSTLGAAALWTLFAIGWTIVLISTFMIGHADLFGLRQVWLNLRERMRGADEFRTPAFYRIVRHPIMVGFLIAFWATPTMTAGHLLFAVATSGYILLAVQLEERDLIATFGDCYRDYRERVPGFIPLRPRRHRPAVMARIAPRMDRDPVGQANHRRRRHAAPSPGAAWPARWTSWGPAHRAEKECEMPCRAGTIVLSPDVPPDAINGDVFGPGRIAVSSGGAHTSSARRSGPDPVTVWPATPSPPWAAARTLPVPG